MKIAFVIYQNAVISGASNGVRSQALTWHRLIVEAGNECVLINHWENYDWASFDAIHVFGHDVGTHTFVSVLSKKNPNIVISPIIDSQKSYLAYKLATYNGLMKARLFSINYSLRKALEYSKGVCVRSDHEGGYFRHAFGLSPERIFKVPLSFGVDVPDDVKTLLTQKRPFCLHVSSLYQERKNVRRLVEAAKRYGFPLVLAGSTGTDEEFAPIREAIGDANNITVAGFVPKDELLRLYTQAKVFALPSIVEGVGIVALDAALYGCNIAITNIKGPSEYWPQQCPHVARVDPLNVDDIGKKIMTLLDTPSSRMLHAHVLHRYSRAEVAGLLHEMYCKIQLAPSATKHKV